jgi:DNA-directed RNA polymerase subunit alpha
MAVTYGKFEMPEKIEIEEGSKTNSFTRFIAEPLEKGYGHTFGTAFRRIMLNSLEAPAIVSVRIEGVPHEYMPIDGVIEDMTHIILNIKGALLRKLSLEEESKIRDYTLVTKMLEVSADMIEANKGQYQVKFADIFGDSDFEMINPDHPIMTVTKPLSKRVDVRVGIGRGYVPSERHLGFEKMVDEIVIDSIFSPVRLVNYYVQNTRVGKDTDFDKLILEVKTDGRITPQEALTFAAQICIEHMKAFDKMSIPINFDHDEKEENKSRDDIVKKLAKGIKEIELSVRSENCLTNAHIQTIGELVIMRESDMLKFRNFGKKSLTEIKSKLKEMKLYLGMQDELEKYGIDKDNIKKVIENYQKEMRSHEA